MAALLAAATAVSSPSALNEQEQRGRDIYTHGTGGEPILAEIRGTGIYAPGSAFPCAQCHGDDGAGGSEGGVVAANIGYEHLMAALDDPETGRRVRAPYNQDRLAAALRLGVNPEGKPLHQAMPRYTISERDIKALLSYLRRLGHEPVAGISDTQLRIGILLPSTGALQPLADAVQALLTTYFADLNARGGIYARRLQLVPVFFDPAVPHAAFDTLKRLHEADPLFCLLGNVGISAQNEVSAYIAERHIPVIAPLAITPGAGNAIDSAPIFYVRPSTFDQARVLVDYLAEELAQPDAAVALLFADDTASRDAAAGTRMQMQRYGMRLVAEDAYRNRTFDASASATALRNAGVESVFLYGSGADLLAFLNEAHRQNWHPRLFAAADLAGPIITALPESMAKQVYLVSPWANPDFKSKSVAEFFRFADAQHIPLHYLALQFSAYAGALLVEATLKLAGRNVTPKKFIAQLETMHDFATDLLPPLSYDTNRRIGTRSAVIASPDPQHHSFTFLTGWREPR